VARGLRSPAVPFLATWRCKRRATARVVLQAFVKTANDFDFRSFELLCRRNPASIADLSAADGLSDCPAGEYVGALIAVKRNAVVPGSRTNSIPAFSQGQHSVH